MCVSNIMTAEKNNTFPGLALVLTHSERESRSLSLNREAILFFPKRYIILYILWCAYTNIYYSKDPKPRKCRLATPRPIERRRGKTFFGILSHFRDTLCHGKTRIGGWVCEEVYRHRHRHHKLLWVFNVDTFSEEEIARASYLFFSLYIRK